MKKNLFMTGACLLVAGVMFVSCEKENGGGDGEGNEKAKILATVDMLPTSQVSYLLPIQDISEAIRLSMRHRRSERRTTLYPT